MGLSLKDQLGVAIQIAANAHVMQLDKSGDLYIEHPFRLMNSFSKEEIEEKILAVLHDVIEDTNIKEQDLRKDGISEKLIMSLKRLTRTKDLCYKQYILNISKDPLAKKVKMKDLEDNSRFDRMIAEPIKKTEKRLVKYMYAYKFLTGSISEKEYMDHDKK